VKIFPSVVMALLLAAGRLDAQAPASTRFGPMEFVVGSCWIGTFPDGKQTDEHCFDWMFDRQFIRDRHQVRGGKPYSGESVYSWDVQEKRVAFLYWNSDGFTSTGYAQETPEGILFPTKYPTGKSVLELRSLWTRTGTDSYRVKVTQLTDGQWRELWSMEFKRKS
jgi:hypothetical protein